MKDSLFIINGTPDFIGGLQIFLEFARKGGRHSIVSIRVVGTISNRADFSGS